VIFLINHYEFIDWILKKKLGLMQIYLRNYNPGWPWVLNTWLLWLCVLVWMLWLNFLFLHVIFNDFVFWFGCFGFEGSDFDCSNIEPWDSMTLDLCWLIERERKGANPMLLDIIHKIKLFFSPLSLALPFQQWQKKRGLNQIERGKKNK
jgi:hypothetical protein